MTSDNPITNVSFSIGQGLGYVPIPLDIAEEFPEYVRLTQDDIDARKLCNNAERYWFSMSKGEAELRICVMPKDHKGDCMQRQTERTIEPMGI